LDFARLKGRDYNHLSPLDVKIDFKSKNGILDDIFTFCAEISGTDLMSNTTYFPVIRTVHFTDKDIFSDGDLALIYIAAILYSINVIYAVIQLIEYLFHIHSYKFLSNCIVLLGLLNLARALYFYLLANHVMLHAPSWVEILLVELPSFLYLSSFTIIIVLWVGIAHSVRSIKAISRKWVKIWFVLLNILLYSAFIVLVVLFEELPNDNKPFCGNRYTASSQFPPKRIVNLILRIFIAFWSIALAVSFQVNGTIIYRALSKVSGSSMLPSNKSMTKTKKIQFFWIALISSVGLLLQSIFLLIIISIQKSNNVATIIILIFVEAIPCFLILLLLHKNGPLSRQWGSSKAAKTGSTASTAGTRATSDSSTN